MKRLWPLLVVLIVLGCGDAGTPTDPGDLPATSVPVVTQSTGFADPPAVGEIVIQPPADGTEGWRYEIDIGIDGSEEVAGEIASGASIPFSFEEPGVHEILIGLTRGDERLRLVRRVIVNDPSATRMVAQRLVATGEHGFELELEGMAYSSSGTEDHLFVSQSQVWKILRLDPNTLEVEDVVSTPTEVDETYGFALSEDEDRLFVMTERSHLLVFSVPDLELVENFDLAPPSQVSPTQYVQVLDANEVVVAGYRGPAVVSTETGEILRERVIEGGEHFSLNPDGSKIALIQIAEDGTRVLFLDAHTLGEISKVTLPVKLTTRSLVTFSPDGDFAYVLGNSGTSTDDLMTHFFVIDLAGPRISLHQPLAREDIFDNVSNPLATSADGRYILVPARSGSYVIDTERNLPLFRVPVAGWSTVAGPGHEFFIAGWSGEVSRVQVVQ